MKTRHWLKVVASVLLAASLGGIIYGRYSVEKTPTKYTRALRGELDTSLESNRQVIEYYKEFEEKDRRIREATTELVDGIGYDAEQLEDGIVITRKLVEQCFEFITELREIYGETEEG